LYKKGFAREGKSESIKIKGKLTSYFKINFNSCFCPYPVGMGPKGSESKRDESNVIFKLREIRNFTSNQNRTDNIYLEDRGYTI
jgi:hypothetical protein